MRNFLFLPLLLLSTQSYAQTFSTSPYSSAGLGEEGTLMDAQFAGLGNIQSLAADSNLVNYHNPASYSFLAPGQPLVSIGLGSRMSSYSMNGATTNSTVAGLNQLVFAFPIRKSFGFSFGTNTFSRKGYNLVTNDYVYNDSVFYQYKGTGSTQRVFLGLSYKLVNTKNHQFAIGANGGYLFGTVNNERYAMFESTASSGGADEKKIRLNSLYADFGLYYKTRWEFKGFHQIMLSSTIAPQQDLKASTEYGLYYSATDVLNKTTYDTLQYSTGTRGTVRYPDNLKVGFGYTYSPDMSTGNRDKMYQLGFYTEFSKTSWSNYSESFENHSSPSFADGQRFSVAFQYTPSVVPLTKAEGSTFFSSIRYRVGYYNQSLPMQSTSAQLKEQAATIGFGIPMANNKKNNSFLNVSVVGGMRNDGTSTGMKEQFLAVSLGVVIGPSFGDRWFRKYKLD